jgi:hypothetical protein
MRTFKYILFTTLLLSGIVNAQQLEYYVGSIGVIGTNYVDRSQVVKISGLDTEEKVGGDDVTRAIKNLWTSQASSLDKFPDDFMDDRNQPDHQVRENL